MQREPKTYHPMTVAMLGALRPSPNGPVMPSSQVQRYRRMFAKHPHRARIVADLAELIDTFTFGRAVATRDQIAAIAKGL